jgi:hypothetical protein
MSLEDLLKQVKSNVSDGQRLGKQLDEISRLDKQRAKNLNELKKRVAKLDEALSKLDKATAATLRTWIEVYTQSLETAGSDLRKTFGAELAEQLHPLGLKLEGQYPLLKAGLFSFEVDFDKGTCQIWYGIQQERLAEVPIDPELVVSALQKQRESLGSQKSAAEFVAILKIAYQHAAIEHDPKNGIPLTSVLVYVALAIQPSAFLSDPIRQKYRSYSRADFSYDLYTHAGEIKSAFHLRVATRQQTQRRSDFLWIPTDSSGNGSTFAIIERKGA